jgi:hypothetical protein
MWRCDTGKNENAPRSDEFIHHVMNKFVTTWLFSEESFMSHDDALKR